MATMTFGNIRVEDLDQRLIDSIQSFFKNKTVEISVIIKEEDKMSLADLDEIIKENREMSPYIVQFEADFDFQELANQLEKDDTFDVMSVLEKRKIPNPYAVAP